MSNLDQAIKTLVDTLYKDYQGFYDYCKQIEGPSDTEIKYGVTHAQEVGFTQFARENLPEIIRGIMEEMGI